MDVFHSYDYMDDRIIYDYMNPQKDRNLIPVFFLLCRNSAVRRKNNLVIICVVYHILIVEEENSKYKTGGK